MNPLYRALLFLLCLIPLPGQAETARAYLEEAFHAAQIGMVSSAGAALRQVGARASAGSDERGALLRERQALSLRLREVEDSLSEANADRVGLTGQAQSLIAAIDGLDARVAQQFPDFAAMIAPDTLSIAEVQAQLHDDEALILFFVGPTFTDVFAISPKKAGWHQIGAGQDTLADAVSRLRLDLDPTAPSRSAESLGGEDATIGRPLGPSFRRYVAFRLYEALLAPLSDVFSQANHVFVVASGPLTSLPIGLLVTENPEGEDNDPAAMRQTAWLIKTHAVTTLPSVESLQVVRSMPEPGDQPLAFLGYGDPVLAGGLQLADLSRGPGLIRAGVADAEQLRSLPSLPQTRKELQQIAQTIGTTQSEVRLGADATETAVKTGPIAGAQVIAFATHGLLSGDLSGLNEPALVLTPPDQPDMADDGLLTVGEILDLNLNADWVILSACNTAGGDSPGAEGLSGLARAFLFAGARSILVSHWPVRDDAAAQLTTETFAALQRGDARGKADALRLAMLSVMTDETDPTLAFPSAWAPFVVVGEGL